MKEKVKTPDEILNPLENEVQTEFGRTIEFVRNNTRPRTVRGIIRERDEKGVHLELLHTLTGYNWRVKRGQIRIFPDEIMEIAKFIS